MPATRATISSRPWRHSLCVSARCQLGLATRSHPAPLVGPPRAPTRFGRRGATTSAGRALMARRRLGPRKTRRDEHETSRVESRPANEVSWPLSWRRQLFGRPQTGAASDKFRAHSGGGSRSKGSIMAAKIAAAPPPPDRQQADVGGESWSSNRRPRLRRRNRARSNNRPISARHSSTKPHPWLTATRCSASQPRRAELHKAADFRRGGKREPNRICSPVSPRAST